ncbi:alpha-tubulin N-acetyltransferase 1 isoform X8 [Oryzias latipes]|uniref:alpha-tubulin N-acetyltransferase 1 isoform X8 n=1 Tax=Oryzias latipes TaxID=8090 RepID=UPI000CE25C91|nr:alpha-tubulin N-acetyltransferase 1 isoform X8 [Oryzias latipes]
MEFPFDINQIFTERISFLDQNLVADRWTARRPDLQANLATVIDELGRASAKAQQLTAAVTSASKLQSQRHQLYLLKDGECSGGRGAVVGFLKVGHKKLFLLDRHGVHVEAEPLCVLDFYIAENLQRHGYGLELFDFMLQHKNVEPGRMAYDRPSPKLLSFLEKHYSLTQNVPQVNNFVVFEDFFFNRAAVQLRKTPPKKPDGEIKPYSLMERGAVRQEQRTPPWPFAPHQSPQRSGSSQCSPPLSVGLSPTRAPHRVSVSSSPGGTRNQSRQSALIGGGRERRSSQPNLVARHSLYSQHMDSGAAGLLDRRLPGLRPVPGQTREYTDTHSSASIHTLQSRSPISSVFPPLPSMTDARAGGWRPSGSTGSVVEDGQVPRGQRSSEASNCRARLGEGGGQNRGRWGSAGQAFSPAQRVKHMQEYRSTRPW